MFYISPNNAYNTEVFPEPVLLLLILNIFKYNCSIYYYSPTKATIYPFLTEKLMLLSLKVSCFFCSK